jgi:hypothetical protein
MAMSMLFSRLDATNTVHGFRSSFRDWAGETGVEFSVAEQCLAHAIGSNVTRSYLPTSMLNSDDPCSRRGASLVCGETGWPGRDPSCGFSKDMEAPRRGRSARG